jgi:hypothetical protein
VSKYPIASNRCSERKTGEVEALPASNYFQLPALAMRAEEQKSSGEERSRKEWKLEDAAEFSPGDSSLVNGRVVVDHAQAYEDMRS